MQGLVKPLLLAIANPNKHAKPALDTLLQTVFINTVDAPSLALIVPVVHRGLRDRSGDAKKKAARIVGNMCALINEPKVHRSSLSIGASMSRSSYSLTSAWIVDAYMSCIHVKHHSGALCMPAAQSPYCA